MVRLEQMACGVLVGVLFASQASAALMFGNTPENIGTASGTWAQYTFGNRFQVTQSGGLEVTHLGYADVGANGLTDSHQMGLWTYGASPTLLGSVTVASGTGESLLNGFRYHELASPVTLQPGVYILGGDTAGTAPTAADTYRYGPEPVGHGLALISRFQSAEGAGFVYPDQSNVNGQAWGSVNMQYTLGPYADQVLSHNPIAYWRFEDPSSGNGDTATNWSTSGAAHDGTYTNDGIQLVSSLPILGQAASLNGGTGGTPTDPINYVVTPDTNFPAGDADRKLIAWVRTAGVSDGSYSSLFAYGEFTWHKLFAAYQYEPEHSLRASKYGDASVESPPGIDVDDGRWHFLALTVEDDPGHTDPLWTIYLDGQKDPASNMLNLTTNTTIGLRALIGQMAGTPYASGWEGEIDEVAIFGRALSEAEISGLYHTVIPEPSSWFLAAFGLVAMLGCAGRRRRR